MGDPAGGVSESAKAPAAMRQREPMQPRYTKSTVANLSGLVKPIISGEATGMCSRWVVRGNVGWRVLKVVLGTWETPRSEPSGGPSN